jgi:hypothetical protein
MRAPPVARLLQKVGTAQNKQRRDNKVIILYHHTNNNALSAAKKKIRAAHDERPVLVEADPYFQVTSHCAPRFLLLFARSSAVADKSEKCKTFPVRAPKQRQGENKKRLRAHFSEFSRSADVRG